MPKDFLYSIDDFDLKNQKVFIRTDFNVPLNQGRVEDHIRLSACLPTIQYALQNKAHVIIGSHRGRPAQGNKKDFSLEPFGHYLGEKLKCETLFVSNIEETLPSILLSSLNEKKILLMENLRFCPGEETADPAWTKQLASHIDIYINDAFSVSHRKHASVYSLPLQVSKRGQGFSMKKEREMLDYIREESAKPFILMLGGVKARDKIKTACRLLPRLDALLVGGVIAYTFLKAKGVFTGSAPIQSESLSLAKEFMEQLSARGKRIFLPVDHVIASSSESLSAESNKFYVTKGQELPAEGKPVDIGPKTIKLFSQALKPAKTIFWNGPFGYFEHKPFDKGTLQLCSELAEIQGAFCAAGGGDSISALLQSGFSEQLDYISTGGGATLKYLEQGSLPGIQSLMAYQI